MLFRSGTEVFFFGEKEKEKEERDYPIVTYSSDQTQGRTLGHFKAFSS